MILSEQNPSFLTHKCLWMTPLVKIYPPVYQIPPPIQIHPRIHIHLIISQILKDLYSHPLNLQNLPHQILLALPLHPLGIHVHPVPRRSPRRKEGKRRRSRKNTRKTRKTNLFTQKLQNIKYQIQHHGPPKNLNEHYRNYWHIIGTWQDYISYPCTKMMKYYYITPYTGTSLKWN